MRDVHDAVAESDSLVEASVRPPGTTPREIDAMQRDVLRKLRLDPAVSVLEIGCGVGLLAVPVAQRAGRYVGIDFAPHAIQVASRRLRAAGVASSAEAICADVLAPDAPQLQALGRFDRVLVYSVLHYARSEPEAMRFLRFTAERLAPRGMALVGNVPLEDLLVDWPASRSAPRGPIARLTSTARWALRPGVSPVPPTRAWKLRHVVEMALNSRARVERFAAARLPSGYTIPLSTAAVERWLSTLGGGLTHHWLLPAPGVPLASGRADLIIARR